MTHYRQASEAPTPITEILSCHDDEESISTSEESSMLYEDYSLGTHRSWLASSSSSSSRHISANHVVTSAKHDNNVHSHTPGRNVYLDFTPTASFELGVDAGIGGDDVRFRGAQAQSRQKNPRIRQRPHATKSSAASSNPHDTFLSQKYDRQRIEHNLERILFGSDTDIYSLTHTIKSDRDDDRDSVDSFTRRFPLHNEEKFKSVRDGSIGELVEEDGDNYEYNEDIRSVNNAIATRNLISAPRLLEGTKNIPSMIKIETFDDDDDDEDGDEDKRKDRKPVDIIHDISESPSIEVKPTNINTATTTRGAIFKPRTTIITTNDQEDEQTRRTRITTTSSSFGYSSYESSTKWKERVGQFDERRPWRKYRSDGEGSTSRSRSSSVPTRTRTHDRYRISTPSRWRAVSDAPSYPTNHSDTHDDNNAHLPPHVRAVVREISTKLQALDLECGAIREGEESLTAAPDEKYTRNLAHDYSPRKDHPSTHSRVHMHAHSKILAQAKYSNKVQSIKTRLREIERQASISTVRR